MAFRIYRYALDESFISKLLAQIDYHKFLPGKVGNGKLINKNTKDRYDYFIDDSSLLEYIDEYFYANFFKVVCKNFSPPLFREKWKIGKYLGTDQSFYKQHRDNTDETAYRKTSIIIGLSDSQFYDGGELCFPEHGKKIKVNRGDMVLFDSSEFHYVEPVTAGLRMVLISFFFDNTGNEIKKILDLNYKQSKYLPLATLNHDPLSFPIDHDYLLSFQRKSKGDVDYSDIAKIRPWDIDDSSYFEDNSSQTLLVSFAGHGWKQSPPTFIFYNFLSQYKDVDKLFLRDLSCRYYLLGLKGVSASLQETVSYLKQFIEKGGYQKVVFLGCSSGGYAALLYSQIVGCDHCIAFSPQTVLNSKKTSIIGDVYNAPKTCEWLTRQNQSDDFYQSCLDLMSYAPFHGQLHIHYSRDANRGSDMKHAQYISTAGCSLHEHPGSDHMIALSLRESGELKTIIDSALYSS